MKTTTLFCFLSFLLLASVSGLGQTGVIAGRVSTSDGQPAEQVNVLLQETQSGTRTPASGEFIFAALKPGTYTLVVSFAGLQTQQRRLLVSAGDTTRVGITLLENQGELAEVVVAGSRSFNDKTVAVGKLPVKAMDLPQSMVVIGRPLLEQQQVLRMSDLLQNVSGVYMVSNTGGAIQEIGGRGFSYGSSNTFKNGIRFNNNAMPEMSSLEKVEFLKGSNAILYGNITAGGAVNLVTKKPKFEKGGELSFRAGSFGFYKPGFDLYGSANSAHTIAYRLNGSWEKASGFREGVKSTRIDFNPSILFQAGKRTRVLVEGEYLNDERTADYGTGAINYAVAPVPRGRLLSVPWGYNQVEQGSATLTITHQLAENWQLRSVTGYQSFNNEIFSTTRPNNTYFIQSNGSWIRGLQKSRNREQYGITEVDLTGTFSTGKIKHSLLAGADLDGYRTVATAFVTNSFNSGNLAGKNIYDTVNIFDPASFNRRNDIPFLPIDRITTSPITRYGIYLQDLVSLAEKWKLLAGIRYSSQNNRRAKVDSIAKNNTGYIAGYLSRAWNPRFGLVYQPTTCISLFTSYANSFNVNTGVDINNQPLRPSLVDQLEAGIKTQWFHQLVSANLTVYRIVNSNLAQAANNPPAGAPANARELAGEVTSKGLEVDIFTRPYLGIQLIAGYSYNDTRYTRSNTYVVGSRLVYNPAHTANLSMYYQFPESGKLKGFNVGATGFYTGKRVAGRSTTVANPGYKLMPLPDFTTVSLSAGYSMNRYSIRCKLSNLFNVLSYYVHDDNSVNPIAPREFAASFTMRF